MKFPQIALIVVLSFAVAFATVKYFAPSNTGTAAPITKESAYDRVMRTGTLRCAYGIYPPFLNKDPNTGKLSGIGWDVMEAVGQISGLKIEWEPEIDWGNIATTLQSGKADAFCSSMFMTPQRGRVIAGSVPVFYSAMEAFARPDDERFDNNLERINQPDVRIAVNLGDISEELAKRLFPKAQLIYKSTMGGESELFLNVANHKADITLSGPNNLSLYNQNNPTSSLRKIVSDHPLMSYQGVIGVDIHETLLQQAINASLYNLISDGTIDRILRANTGKDYGVAYFPAKSPLN